MAVKNYFYLSEKEKELLFILFSYRGMRAKDLVVFHEKTIDYTLSQEKSVYNYLADLREKGFVKSVRLQGIGEKGSLYYLSPEGLEAVKTLKDINVGQSGNGWLPEGHKTRYWDIPYSYQEPPLRQTGHFLQTIDIFKKLVADQDWPYSHQTNFYSILHYEEDGVKKKLMPDGAVILRGKFYGLEADRATEGFDQLVKKFKGYRAYNEYAYEQGKRPVTAILFVVPEKSRRHGMTRRWTTVLSAFFSAFEEQFPAINLIFMSVDDVPDVLEFEQSRLLEMEAKKAVIIAEMDAKKVTEYDYCTAVSNDFEYTLVVAMAHHEFESYIFSDILGLLLDGESIIKDEYFKSLKSNDVKMHLEVGLRKPVFPVGLEKTGLSKGFLELLDKIKPFFGKY